MQQAQCIKVSIGVGVFVVVLISIILIAVSFESVDETEYCLKYDVHSRVVEPEPYLNAGNYFVGLTSSFICYPRNILSMQLEGSSKLTARDKNGLSLDLDIVVEYRLRQDELYDLFNELLTEYENYFHRLARSELRNSASKFAAEEYLGAGRANISTFMTEKLNTVFSERHANTINVQLKDVFLPTVYDSAIRAVEASKLDADKATQERAVAVNEESKDNQTQVILTLADRQKILLNEETNVIKASLTQESVLTQEQLKADLALLEVQTERANILIQAQSDIDKAESRRAGRLTLRRTEQSAAVIQFRTRINEAEAQSDVKIISANATAQAFLKEKEATIEAIKEKRAEELTNLLLLKDSLPDMNSTQILQLQYIEALRGHRNAFFTLDYRKVPFDPLLSTVSGQAAEIKKLQASLVV